MKKTAINNLKVDENLLDFIDNEVIPGTGIDPKKFWSAVSYTHLTLPTTPYV